MCPVCILFTKASHKASLVWQNGVIECIFGERSHSKGHGGIELKAIVAVNQT